MKNIVLSFICVLTYTFAEVTAFSTPQPIIVPEPPPPIVRPVRPVVQPFLVHEEYKYFTNVVTNCDEYIKIITQKDQEIETLRKEIESLKNKEYIKLQETLKAQYELELKKFDQRKSGIKNSIDNSEK